MAVFMLVLVKLFAHVSIYLMHQHIYLCIYCILPLIYAVPIQQPTNQRNATRRAKANADCKAPHFECEKNRTQANELGNPYEVLENLIEPFKAS